MPRVLSTLLKLLQEFVEHGPSEEELNRVRKRTQWQYEAIVDSPAELADFIAHATLKGTVLHPEERLGALLKVEKSELMQIAREIFRPAHRFVIVVGSPSEKAIEEARALSLDELSKNTF